MKGLVAVMVLGIAVPVPVSAEGPIREITESLGASVNELGLGNTVDLSWRWRLYGSEHPLLSNAHVSLGLSQSLTPSHARIGAWVAYAPVSVLEIKAGYEPVYYFGSSGSLLGFDDRGDDFSADARRALDSKSVSGAGVRAFVGTTVRLRLGQVLASTGAEAELWFVDGPGRYFYEPSRDTLLSSDGDTLIRGSSLLLYEWDRGSGRKLLALGDRRLGVRKPTLLLNAFYYLEDPSKKGEIGASVALRFSLTRQR